MSILVIFIIIVALVFDFLNGMKDAANSIATIVSTRVLSPKAAVAWAAFFNFSAVFLFGVHVATTVGKGIVEKDIINEWIILSALIGAVIWIYFCLSHGVPISVSHALIGGLIGPALIAGGTKVLVWSGIIKVLLFLVLSPIIGFILGYFIMIIVMLLSRKTSPRKVDSLFRILQFTSSAAFSISHGSNDAQKTMGIIAILLYSAGYLGSEFYVPVWVIIASYSTIALGTLLGGWKVVKTLGVGLTHLKPSGGFCAETAGAITIISSSLMGIPVSTTHTITGAIMGVGVTKRFSSVRWIVANNIVTAWILTIPVALIVSALVYLLILGGKSLFLFIF